MSKRNSGFSRTILHIWHTSQGIDLNELIAEYSLTQIIYEPKHVLEPCIDLTFISQENLITSLRSFIIGSKLFSNFSIKFNYPPPYEPLIWK